MGKIETLKMKYTGHVTNATIDKIIEGDFTDTKKYSEYMLMIWSRKRNTMTNITVASLIQTVTSFDTLLPFIENKDIYSGEYKSFDKLVEIVKMARLKKAEKDFIREDHIRVIFEDENLLMLHPLTHKGSLKYGYGTRWCTASVNNAGTFKQYVDKYLVYIINKKGDKGRNFNKIALFVTTGEDTLTSNVVIYEESDNSVRDSQLIRNGWTVEEIHFITLQYYSYMFEGKAIKANVDKVKRYANLVKSINLDDLAKSMNFIQNYKTDTTKEQAILKEFVEKISIFNKKYFKENV